MVKKIRFTRKTFGQIILQLVLIILAFIALFPFIWMISTSLKGSEEAFA